MLDIVKSTDTWFVNIMFAILTAYFLWSIKGLFRDLKDSISELKKLITDLYEHRNEHERRITSLETKCSWEHGDINYTSTRQSGGRRSYDPEKVPGAQQ